MILAVHFNVDRRFGPRPSEELSIDEFGLLLSSQRPGTTCNVM